MSHLNITNFTKTVGAKTLFQNIGFSLVSGERAGLIGINGTGKSTLLSVIAGEADADSIDIDHPKQYRITYLPQDPVFAKGQTVLEAVFSGDSPVLTLNRQYEAALQRLITDSASEKLQDELLNLQTAMEQQGAWDINALAKTALTKLGIDQFDREITEMSGGQQKRVALAKTLIEPADLILLDEPTNHLDAESAEWLQETLTRMSSAMLFVTHDRYFLDAVSTHIFELADKTLYTHKGNYGDYLEAKAIREEAEAATQQKLENRYRSELKWIRRGAKARTTKQKARIQRFEKLQDVVSSSGEDSTLDLQMAGSRLGKKVIEGEDLHVAYGDRVIFSDFSFLLQAGDRIGIVGPNGAGKSTLMKLIAGEIEPDSGSLDYGSTVKIAHFTQHLPAMEESQRVIDYVRETSNDIETSKGVRVSATQMLERFLFQPNAHGTQIGKLSGGERKRLYLLKLLMEQPNVLLLDEPTNDLDIQTLSVLEEFLENFQGVVIAISHDRFFLDRIARKLWSVKNGEVEEYLGLYSEYIQRKDEPDVTAVKQPKQTREKQQKKVSYKEKMEWETIHDRIEQTEQAIEEAEMKMATLGSDFTALQELQEQIEKLNEDYEQLIERWSYLQELMES